MIVADAGPLITFARIGRLDLLQAVARELIVPEAIYDEVVVKGSGRPGSLEVAMAKWVRRRSLAGRSVLAGFPEALSLGDREVIALAQELALPVLIDEWLARAEARHRGLLSVGAYLS